MESLNEECPICLSCISTTDHINDIYITQCCKKLFHHTCYIECMKIKTESPLCRAGQVVIFINPVNTINTNNTNINTDDITTNNNNSLCCELYRYWGTVVCGIFLCTSLIISMNHYSSKN